MTLWPLSTLGKKPMNLLHRKLKLAGLWSVRCVKRMHENGTEPLYSNCRQSLSRRGFSCHKVLTDGRVMYEVPYSKYYLYCWVWGCYSSADEHCGLLDMTPCTFVYWYYMRVIKKLVYRYQSFERACFTVVGGIWELALLWRWRHQTLRNFCTDTPVCAASN
jgi:hypothetical protein